MCAESLTNPDEWSFEEVHWSGSTATLFWMSAYFGLFWASTTLNYILYAFYWCHRLLSTKKKWMRNLSLSPSCIASLPRFHPSLHSATAVIVHTLDQIIQELSSVLQPEEWQAEDTEKWDVTGLTPSVHTLESNTAAVRQNWMKRDAAVACLMCPVILKIRPEQPGVLRQTILLT